LLFGQASQLLAFVFVCDPAPFGCVFVLDAPKYSHNVVRQRVLISGAIALILAFNIALQPF
jgi:hypothetical protein